MTGLTSIQRSVKALAIVVALFGFLFACRKKDNKKEEPTVVFDKQAMLVNYADHLIIPSFQDWHAKVGSLRSSWQNFEAAPDTAKLRTLKADFFDAYTSYQRTAVYGFGPGEEKGIRINFNIYPSDTVKIENNIKSGSYDLSTASNLAAKGFPALEYLFYGFNHSAGQVAARLAGSPARRAYVNSLLTEIESLSSQITSEWTAAYRSAFVNSLGTDVGSSIGFLINQLNYELDNLKNAKLATPVGLRSAGVQYPAYTEAFYSGRSMELVKETFNTIENVYLGRSFGGNNGSGFDDYIIHLKAAHVNGTLHDAITAQFGVARSKINAVPDPLSVAVSSNKGAVEDAYRELVKLLALLKTDLPSSLGVVITYQDGDGD